MQPMAPSRLHPKIDSLTGLRFIAAYFVLISHVLGKFSLGIDDAGGASVQLFFTLSGFVMYLNYKHKIDAMEINFKTFFLLRLARLYPVYILCVMMYLVYYHQQHIPFDQLRMSFITSVLMLQSWVGNMAYAFNVFNPPSWSVSNEMFFYLVFFGITWLFSVKQILRIFIVYTIINIFLILYLQNLPDLISFKWVWYINPLFRLIDFMVGYIISYLFLRFQGRLKWNSWYTLTGILSLILLFGTEFFLPIDKYWYSIFITSLVSAFLIFNLSFNQGVLSKILSTKTMILLGEASYTLYLIHYFTIFVLCPRFFQNPVMLYLSQFILPVVFSIVIYKLYEIKIYNFLRKQISKPKKIIVDSAEALS